MTSFVENSAVLDGGAISLTDPIEVYIVGASFVSNQALFGGAVSLASTIPTTGGLQRCRFETNDASNGGALYLSTAGTSDTGLPLFVEDSVFRHNIAGESPPTAASSRLRFFQNDRTESSNRASKWYWADANSLRLTLQLKNADAHQVLVVPFQRASSLSSIMRLCARKMVAVTGVFMHKL